MNPKNNNKIKIAYVMPSLDRGGAERFFTDLIINLDASVYEPVFILFKRGGAWAEELQAKHIPVIILEKKYKLDPINFWRLFKALKSFRPQIVHTQLGGDLYGRLAARLLKTPIIISTETNVNRDEKLIMNILKRITARYADKIVAVSQAVKEDLIARYRTDPQKIQVIYNGLEVAKFLSFVESEKPQPDSQKTTITFGTIGRLAPQKGHSILIKAWSKLNNQRLLCKIGGVGPLANALTAQIKNEKLETQVKLVGPVTNVLSFLSSLDVFVFPSLWEGQGIVLLEAGLCGLPVIASAVDGITEVITEETGWLVPAGDVDALAEKIIWLTENLNTPAVTEKTRRLREQIISRFDIKNITAQYQDVYINLFKHKGLL